MDALRLGFGFINLAFEMLLLLFTIHMLRIRKDIWKKPTIMLLLSCIHIAVILATISSFIRVYTDSLLFQIPNSLVTLLRDASILIITQRLCYLLQSASLMPKMVSMGLFVVLGGHIVVWIVLIYIWQPYSVLDKPMFWYSLSSESTINLLYCIVLIRYSTGFGKLMEGHLIASLTTVGIMNIIRLIYFAVYNQFDISLIRKGIFQIVLSLCSFLSIQYFLIAIMQPSRRRPSQRIKALPAP